MGSAQVFRSACFRAEYYRACCAYTIALASLIASIDLARAAAGNTADPSGLIWHADVSGEPSPDGETGNACADTCCIGCLMLMAALPPPPAATVQVARTLSRAVARIETPAVARSCTTRHQNVSLDFGIDKLFSEYYFLFHPFPGRTYVMAAKARF